MNELDKSTYCGGSMTGTISVVQEARAGVGSIG